MTTPLIEIIDRDQPVRDVKEHYEPQLLMLQDMVNYGSNLIARCYRSSDHRVADVVVLSALLKHAVAMLDATEICLSNAAVMASHAPLRTLYETSLYIAWILDADTDQRARRYYVAEQRVKRNWARTCVPGTAENIANQHIINELSASEIDPAEAKRQADEIDAFLSQAVYAPFEKEFDDAKKSFDVHWYSLPKGSGAPTSIRQLAEKLGKLSQYDVIYAGLCKITHGSAFGKHITVEDGEVTFEPIRQLEDIVFVMQTATGAALEIYRLITEHYRPLELPNFNVKYRDDWRPALASMKQPKYTTIKPTERL